MSQSLDVNTGKVPCLGLWLGIVQGVQCCETSAGGFAAGAAAVTIFT